MLKRALRTIAPTATPRGAHIQLCRSVVPPTFHPFSHALQVSHHAAAPTRLPTPSYPFPVNPNFCHVCSPAASRCFVLFPPLARITLRPYGRLFCHPSPVPSTMTTPSTPLLRVLKAPSRTSRTNQQPLQHKESPSSICVGNCNDLSKVLTSQTYLSGQWRIFLENPGERWPR